MFRRLNVLVVVLTLWGCGGGGGDAPIAAAPTAVAIQLDTFGAVFGEVLDQQTGVPVPGATVSVNSVKVNTGLSGGFSISNLPLDRLAVSIQAPGYADNTVIAKLNANQGQQRLTIYAQPVGYNTTFDPLVAQSVSDPASLARVVLPANAFQTLTGTAPVGKVTVAMSLLGLNAGSNPTLTTVPGDFTTSTGSLQSLGTLALTFKDEAGSLLNLAPGKIATIRTPAPNGPDISPAAVALFSFNELKGIWNQEGNATLVGSSAGSYYEGVVSHFSTWLFGEVLNPVQVKGRVVDELGAPFVGVTVGAISGKYEAVATVVTDAAGNFNVPVKPNTQGRILAYLNDVQTAEVSTKSGSADITLSPPLVLPRIAAARINLGVPVVFPLDRSDQKTAEPCCRFFGVDVPFQALGTEIKRLVETNGTTNGYLYGNARWEFGSNVRLCDRPPVGVPGFGCSEAWLNSGQQAPYLNSFNPFDYSGYLASSDPASSTTLGKVSFRFSHHYTVAVYDSKGLVGYQPIGPVPVTVTAVLAVTAVNPVTSKVIVIRSKPITVSY